MMDDLEFFLIELLWFTSPTLLESKVWNPAGFDWPL